MWSFLGIALSSALTLASLVLTRRAARDVGRRQERAESYGFIRWAADIAISPDRVRRATGIDLLQAVNHSDLVDEADQRLAAAVLLAVTRQPHVP